MPPGSGYAHSLSPQLRLRTVIPINLIGQCVLRAGRHKKENPAQSMLEVCRLCLSFEALSIIRAVCLWRYSLTTTVRLSIAWPALKREGNVSCCRLLRLQLVSCNVL